MAGKLTKAQYDLLHGLKFGSETIVDTYRPARKLVDLGFARWEYGTLGSSALHITEDGRRALAAKESAGEQ